ncbi:DUF805 domain-containing protein [Vibrio sp. V27_P1S3P104]|uniref:DUF805 domain-containing protein n=1 Tax=Vibrio TaxID=662 RepID=UPI000C16F937|nr:MULTISPECIES: DUF805 domain-containing protein [Vibrio]NAW70738.1 DUF805 domain-containing protein [Vibrio sp. V28_P6S34P95]NAX05930.1 DUF805 domain-containing protein [Vibrio sp. V30_P3S12P165]NAX35603.1 DUF805 domain-containing protein [Vibrio sp. V29_P1S30P107]NAX37751.1 DUF805 domain-containing protein [Vibrio sp. V27_P1S3P104]NAX41009.1 DUF805 domain-containing protein [Vibrio sp. V26_P1S5P106]
MPLQSLLFSFQGRISRQTFWVWNGCYYLFIAVFIVIANRFFPNWAASLLPVVMLIILLPDLAITAKRWHDRDKSSWWLLLNLPLILGRMSVPVGEASLATSPSWFDSFLAFAALGCGSWILVECGFLMGTQGDNRFGRDPLSR